jgi:hypothetical protein
MSLELWSLLITLVVSFVSAIIVIYSWRRMRIVSYVMPLWFIGSWLLSTNGFFEPRDIWQDGDLVSFAIFGTLMSLPVVVFGLAFVRSAKLREFLGAIPMQALVGIQVYRMAGGIFLWMWLAGLMPAEMGIVTGSMDIFIGITAILLAWGAMTNLKRVRGLLWMWNIIGIADFIFAISLVSLSILGLMTLTPDPVRIGTHPLALISLFQVPLSIILHGLGMYRLSQKGN